jgi:hypothetical protein
LLFIFKAAKFKKVNYDFIEKEFILKQNTNKFVAFALLFVAFIATGTVAFVFFFARVILILSPILLLLVAGRYLNWW